MNNYEYARALEQRQNDSALKFVYFLLAATGAGIGFVVQKLDQQTFDTAGTLLLLGAVSWLLSVAFGCLSLKAEVWMKAVSVQIMHVHIDAEQGRQMQEGEESLESLREAWLLHSNRAQLLLDFQFGLLIGGGALLILWRVVEMWQLSR